MPKRCPFCGEEPKVWKSMNDKEAADCNNKSCLMYQEGGVYLEYWDKRPLEDELIKVIKDLTRLMVGETDIGWIPRPKFREMFPELSEELEKIQIEEE